MTKDEEIEELEASRDDWKKVWQEDDWKKVWQEESAMLKKCEERVKELEEQLKMKGGSK